MRSQVDQRKRRGAAREWTTVNECSSKEDADVWMSENGGYWTYDSDNSSNKFTDQIDTRASGVTANSCRLFRDWIQFVCTSHEY
uniref:C-type lectin domain-containing protein n=1 Tax=Ditylenchus dipsaci TaxID=166011 RepID=A0A915DFW2_9BILA